MRLHFFAHTQLKIKNSKILKEAADTPKIFWVAKFATQKVCAHLVCTLIFLVHTEQALKKQIGKYQPQS